MTASTPAVARPAPSSPESRPSSALSVVTRASTFRRVQPLVRITPNSTNRSVVLISIVLAMPDPADEHRQADRQEQEQVEPPHDRADRQVELR